jgi:P-type E1-E2 ATPase
MIEISIPGLKTLRLHHLALDVNGTIAKDGHLIEGTRELLAELEPKLAIHLITADTHGRLEDIRKNLNVTALQIPPQNQADAKLDYIRKLGADSVVAVGNGANDAAMLKQAALGIVIVGPEGAAVESLLQADVAVGDIRSAIELLLYPKRLIATLRR